MKFQLIGLRPDAHEWLTNHVKKFVQSCPHCKEPIKNDHEAWIYTEPEIYDAGTLPLWAYQLTDGTTIKEVVQTVGRGKGPAVGVPLVFLCLKSMDGKKYFEWPNYIVRIWKEEVN